MRPIPPPPPSPPPPGAFLRPAGAQHDLLGALLLGAFSLGPVDVSIVNGRQVVADGKLLTADLAALIADVNERSERLCRLLPPASKGA